MAAEERQLIKSWGDGGAAPGSGDIGAVATVVIAGRKSLLTQREKGADKHFFGGACGSPQRFDTETWESVSTDELRELVLPSRDVAAPLMPHSRCQYGSLRARAARATLIIWQP